MNPRNLPSPQLTSDISTDTGNQQVTHPPSSAAFLNLGMALFRSGWSEQADRALELKPEEAGSRLMLSQRLHVCRGPRTSPGAARRLPPGKPGRTRPPPRSSDAIRCLERHGRHTRDHPSGRRRLHHPASITRHQNAADVKSPQRTLSRYLLSIQGLRPDFPA